MLSGVNETESVDHSAQCTLRGLMLWVWVSMWGEKEASVCPDKCTASSLSSDILPGLRLHRLDLPSPLPLSLTAADCLVGWMDPGQNGGFSCVTPFSMESLISATVGRGLHTVAFAAAHLDPTATQCRVDAHIHYNDQVGGLWCLFSQHFSPRWILRESHDQSSNMSGIYAHRVSQN